MKRTQFVFLFILLAFGLQAQREYDVAAFVWPAYFNEPRFKDIGVFPDGKGEWEAIYSAKSKFEGHQQPRVPLWGYLDESDPKTQEKVIETALEYGVNTFIFDWYWYDNKPFLEDVLNKGFLKAKNNGQMKFYLMWANHTHNSYLDPKNPDKNLVYWEGGVNRATFDNFTRHLIKDYFKRPNYYTIDGKPVFAIYEVSTFIKGMGGEEQAREALDAFRKKCVDAGLPGVHIQAILWGNIPSSLSATPGDKSKTQDNTIRYFGFESLTNYQWCHFVPTNQDYQPWGEQATAKYKEFGQDFSVPYFPHVSISWDPNPRFPEGIQPCVSGVTPEKFERFLYKAKDYADTHPDQPPLITINAWNEWAEGSYLEPDTQFEYGFLKAIKNVFKPDQSAKATWIWYPGDFELWLSSKIQIQRTERGVFYAPFWRMDRHTPLITFDKTVDLAQDEYVDIQVDGQFYLKIDGGFVYENCERVLIPKGKHTIHFQVYNPETPPSIWVKGQTIFSDKTWQTGRQTGQSIHADAWTFDSPESRPSAYKLATIPQKPVKITKDAKSVFVDFGKETFGYLRLHQLKGNGTITACYGESEDEAQAGKEAETYDVFKIAQPAASDFVAPGSKAFRYIKFTWEGDLSFEDVSMLYEYIPVEMKGSFQCSDEEINKIWEVAAYTLHLSSHEFFLDGIKRDRWIWSGDAYQSYLMNYYLFFDNPLVKRTTWALRGNDPVETHINTIMDYSFYWFMGIYDYYRYTGDKEFVQQIYPKMLSMMDFCLGRRNAGGMVEGLPGDWVFVDWAPITKDGELCIEQILLCRSLETMALCADLMNDAGNVTKYRKLADELKKKISELFWDPEQKALVHNRVNGKPSKTVTKYANMFALIFDYANDSQKEDIRNHVLLNDAVQKITTPYMRFYELEALCRINQQEHVLREIKDYWGGMLRLGATSFWEEYNPTLSGAEHYAMYGRPFGKSLCHAWGASPIYLLGKYYLGVTPTGPGYQTYLIEPELAGLKWMKGEVPTPAGNITLSVSEKQITVETVAGNGTLRFKSSKKPACKSGIIRSTTPGNYELDLEPNRKYEVNYSAVK